MKRRNRVNELGKYFIALFLLAAGMGLVAVFGILLMPVVVAYILVLAIREIFIWKRKFRDTDAHTATI